MEIRVIGSSIGQSMDQPRIAVMGETMIDPAPRKFLSEFAVNLYSARWIMVTPSDLMAGGEIDADTAELVERCHICLICRRPSFSYDPASFKFDDGKLSGKLVYKVGGKRHELSYALPFKLADGATMVRLSSYPHKDIETLLPSGECVRHVLASLRAHYFAPQGILRQLEVLYVGQAYAEGRRSALDRLKSHATLQKILADVVRKMPDDEILLLTFEYLPYRVITSMDGTDKTAVRDESDTKRFFSIVLRDQRW
jgi:hypothetical protein